jgi:hypothetical protein
MTKHIDKFGREWKFTPHHNTDRMIKVPTEIMERFILADRLIVGPWDQRQSYFRGQEVECYVLRMGSLEDFPNFTGVCTGARWSDDGPDYYSSLLHQGDMVKALLRYMYKHGDVKNHAATVEIYRNQLEEIW